jgi:ribonuclease HI
LQFNSETEKCTNNTAEYEAILLGLRKLRAIGVQRCTLHTDSNVVTGEIEKECIARDATLEKYLALVRRMKNYFKGFTVEHIDRNKNTEADELVKAVACNTPLLVDVFTANHIRHVDKNDRGGAKNHQCNTGRRLASSDNGVPSPLL